MSFTSYNLHRSNSNYTMNYIMNNNNSTTYSNNNMTSNNSNTNVQKANNNTGYNFNLQLIPSDKLNHQNNLVNNDLTGNTLTDEINQTMELEIENDLIITNNSNKFNLPSGSNNIATVASNTAFKPMIKKTISNNHDNALEEFWNTQISSQTRNKRSNSNNTMSSNNMHNFSKGRRLSISEYNFDNANYYEYEDFEKNINSNIAFNTKIMIDQNNMMDTTENIIVDRDEFTFNVNDTNSKINKLMLTEHEINFDNDIDNEVDMDSDMLTINNDLEIPLINAAEQQESPISKRRVRDYFKLNIFNSNSNATNTTTTTNDRDLLIEHDNLNDEPFMIKKKYFWNSKGNQLLKKFNNKNKNNTLISNFEDQTDQNDIDVSFFDDDEEEEDDDDDTNSQLIIEESNLNISINPSVLFNNEIGIKDEEIPYTIDSLSQVHSEENEDNFSPMMTVAPSMVTSDSTTSATEAIKSMNPFLEHNDDRLSMNSTPVTNNRQGSNKPVIRRKSSNTMPKTRGRKPSAILDASKQFCCEYCDRRFKRQEHLKRHIRSLHICEKPFSCPVCEKNFSRSDNLNQHIKTHSPTNDEEDDKSESNN